MADETFYTSSEIARQLGINDATLRTWKSRYSDRFQENVHWVRNGDGSTLWSEAGLTQLKNLRNNGNGNGNGNGSAAPKNQDATGSFQQRATDSFQTDTDAFQTDTGSFQDDTAFQDETDLEEEGSLQDRYAPMVEAAANALAPEILYRIDQRVTDLVGEAIANKKTPRMTAVDCVSVLKKLGLKPANPERLIGAAGNRLLNGSSGNGSGSQLPQLPQTQLPQNGNGVAGLLNSSETPATAETSEAGATVDTVDTIETTETSVTASTVETSETPATVQTIETVQTTETTQTTIGD